MDRDRERDMDRDRERGKFESAAWYTELRVKEN
jgi:hypothetical protein